MTPAKLAGSFTSGFAWSIPETSMRPRPRSTEPFLFGTDPDGYELEIWYELPTPVDPT